MHVFLVHGYLAPSRLLWPIARRLRRAEFETTLFDYPSRRGTLEEHAQALAQRVIETKSDRIGFVGHSLGGLIIRRTLELLDSPADRVVFVATPHKGSAFSRRMRASLLGRWISNAGRSTARGLDGPIRAKKIGVIAGTRDRTVTAEEALLDDAEALLLPYTHNELLFRPRTANAITRFFETSSFEVELDRGQLTEHLRVS